MYKFVARDYLSDLVEWMREQMHRCSGKTAVVGISGGKGSAVTAALCVEAFGRDAVVGVQLPKQI